MEQAKIASALVKAQKAFGPALKTAANGGFKGAKYADLNSCVDAVLDALNDNGIMLMQIPHECDNGALVETVFLHESGEEWRAGKMHVPASKHDAHGYGSALTYARRYGLMAACGIAPEDDDGNAATKAAPVKISNDQVIADWKVALDECMTTEALSKRREEARVDCTNARDADAWRAIDAHSRIVKERLTVAA